MLACTHRHTPQRASERASERWESHRNVPGSVLDFSLSASPAHMFVNINYFSKHSPRLVFAAVTLRCNVLPTLLRKAAAIFKSNRTAQTAFNRLKLPSGIIKARGPLLMCKYTLLREEHLITKSCGVIKCPNTRNVQLLYGCISDSVPQLSIQTGSPA